MYYTLSRGTPRLRTNVPTLGRDRATVRLEEGAQTGRALTSDATVLGELVVAGDERHGGSFPSGPGGEEVGASGVIHRRAAPLLLSGRGTIRETYLLRRRSQAVRCPRIDHKPGYP